jgi:hypothetical protein
MKNLATTLLMIMIVSNINAQTYASVGFGSHKTVMLQLGRTNPRTDKKVVGTINAVLLVPASPSEIVNVPKQLFLQTGAVFNISRVSITPCIGFGYSWLQEGKEVESVTGYPLIGSLDIGVQVRNFDRVFVTYTKTSLRYSYINAGFRFYL